MQWLDVLSEATLTATVDKTIGGSALHGLARSKLGGAISLNSSTANRTDNSFFGALAAGNRVFMHSGSFTMGIGSTIANRLDREINHP